MLQSISIGDQDIPQAFSHERASFFRSSGCSLAGDRYGSVLLIACYDKEHAGSSQLRAHGCRPLPYHQ
jgi:hypothetical protein